MFNLIYADGNGNIYDAPGIMAVGCVGKIIQPLHEEDMIPLPDGTDIMYLPQRSPLGLKKQRLESLDGLYAVAAILPVGYTRTHLPAYSKKTDAPVLPLYGYTAVGMKNGELFVAAIKTDDNVKWHPFRYNTRNLKAKVNKLLKVMPNNPLVSHLGDCSLKWHCCTAQNLFYHRWEAGIPTSPVCNANCLGCISLQPSECCPSPQSRIKFKPSPEEIAQIGIYHLSDAPDAIISFGQGCEGEPSLAYENISAAIKLIRQKTSQGIININTNAGFTTGIKSIVNAGLDSMRVSMISAVPDTYDAYYRSNYCLENVIESIIYAKQQGVFVSVNMLLMPGINDCRDEIAAWIDFIGCTKIDMIQLRNLNIDPDWLNERIPFADEKTCGVKNFITKLLEKHPNLRIGNFSPYIRK